MHVRCNRIPALPPYAISAIVYGSIFALMSVSLTLTYITTKVPNFAQGALVTAGLYTGFAFLRVNKINPYDSLPLAFLVGGAIAVGIYLLVLNPLAKRGASVISLMIATLAVDIIFIGIFGIYSDYLFEVKEVYDAKVFYALTSVDFSFLGVDGVVFVAPVALALITVGLYLMLTRTAVWARDEGDRREPRPCQSRRCRHADGLLGILVPRRRTCGHIGRLLLPLAGR